MSQEPFDEQAGSDSVAEPTGDALGNIRIEPQGSGVRIAIPPAGYATGCVRTALGIFLLIASVIVTLSRGQMAGMGSARDLLLILLWGSTFAVLSVGFSAVRRRVLIEADATRLSLAVSGLWGFSREEWAADDVVSVTAEDSNTSIDHKPIPQIRIHPSDRDDSTVMIHRPRPQVELVVAVIRKYFEPKGRESPVDLKKMFLLTRIRQWRPGEVVEVASPKLTSKLLLGVVGTGVVLGIIGGLVLSGILGAVIGHKYVSMVIFVLLGAVTATSLAIAVVQAALTKSRLFIDWKDRKVTTQTARKSATHSLDEIEAIIVRPVVTYEADTVDDDRQIEKGTRYRGQLLLRIAGEESIVLMTDRWTSTADESTSPLVPFALELTDALPVEIEDIEPIDWSEIKIVDWRCAHPMILAIGIIGCLLILAEIGHSIYRAFVA